MTVYYIATKSNSKYIFNGAAIVGPLTFQNITNQISSISHFCRDEESITTKELNSYLGSGITFYTLEGDNLSGVIEFSVNVNYINIMGLCVPYMYKGIGNYLMQKVIQFAKINSIQKIKLTCYGNVHTFYRKLGFTDEEMPKIYYDTDEDSDDERGTEAARGRHESKLQTAKGGA